jgi:hypothetical protein
MIYAIIMMGLLTWFIWYYTKQAKTDGYLTRFFEDSPESKEVLKKMKSDGISEDSLAEFSSMEDRLLMLMRQTRPTPELARAQSQQIKDRFLGYDFGYHEKILKKRSKLLDIKSSFI